MISGTPRFTFDVPDLFAGINFIPVMIGFFALNEVMKLFANRHDATSETEQQSVPQQGTVFGKVPYRSEEHTSELQSLMRISYAVFGLQKHNNIHLTSTQ